MTGRDETKRQPKTDDNGLVGALAAAFSPALPPDGFVEHCVHPPVDQLLDLLPPVKLGGKTNERRPSTRFDRYELFGEIGSGGMGVVFEGRDTELGREVAVKILRPAHRDNLDAQKRFITEARVSGQLQHPGIPPVYELGEFEPGQPFLTMKLVRGKTLAQLLQERENPLDGQTQLLEVLEQVCQTLAFAHAQRVIHRDVKPSNVMVGTFGEVLMMDWGLAKVLSADGSDDTVHCEAASAETPASGNFSRENRACSPESVETQTGHLMGTPAWISPEQARGEVSELDERTDVFGLGAILCEILTGQPPYVAANEIQLRNKAITADLAEALQRLDHCEADPDVVVLTRQCLSHTADNRPRDAGAVADAMSNWRKSFDNRLRLAELENAASRAAAKHERRVRWMTIVLASFVLMFGAAGGVFWHWVEQDRHHRAMLANQREERRLKEEIHRLMEDQTETVSSVIRDDLFGAIANSGMAGGELTADQLLGTAESIIDTAFIDKPYVEIAVRQFLANVYRGRNRTLRAIEHADEIVKLLTEHSGSDHPMTVEAREYLRRLHATMRRSGSGEPAADESAVVSLFGAAYEKVVLVDRPLGYWRLNERSDESTAHDSSGNDYHGRFFGTRRADDGSTAFQLSELGTDDYVRIETFPFPAKGVSVEFWMRTREIHGSTILSYFAERDGVLCEWLIGNCGDLAVEFPGPTSRTGVTLNDGRWHHVVIKWQASDRICSVFKDGELVRELEQAGDGTLFSGGCLVFGQDQDTEGGSFEEADCFQGWLAEVAVYDRELTAEQVRAHFEAGAPLGAGIAGTRNPVRLNSGESSYRYRDYVVRCLDTLIEHGTDMYGPEHTPLFMAILDTRTLQSPQFPERFDSVVRLESRLHRRGTRGSNLWFDQATLRAMYRVSKLTEDPRYAQAADAYVAYALDHCRKPEGTEEWQTGMPAWGSHVYWDCYGERATGDGNGDAPHEILVYRAEWAEMYRVNPRAVREIVDGIWKWHVVDKETGQHNRHDNGIAEFDFAFSGGVMAHAFAFMYSTTGEQHYLHKAKLVSRWHWQHRYPETGLVADTPGRTSRTDGQACFTTVTGPFAAMLLECHRLTRDDEFRDMAVAYIQAYDKFGWDAEAETYHAMLRLDGTPVPDREKPAGYDAYFPYGHVSVWRTLIFSYEFALSAAQASVTASNQGYQASGDPTYDPELLKIAGRWASVIEKNLPPTPDRRWKTELERALPAVRETGGVYAEDYGRAISFFVHMHRATGEARYLKLAKQLADEAIEKLYDNGLFRGHPAKPYYEATNGVGILLFALLELEAPTEELGGAM